MSKNIILVLNMLHDAEIEFDDVSPNFIADFAFKRDIELKSEEVVLVSNLYGEKNDPTGRI